MRHVVQHFLTLYSYFNFSAQVCYYLAWAQVSLIYQNCFVQEFDNASLQALKDLEPSMNDLFTKTEEWQTFYEAELQVWGTVHHSAHQCILADFQLYVGLLPSQQPVKATTTW